MAASEEDIANSLLDLCSKSKINGRKKNAEFEENLNGQISQLRWKQWKNQPMNKNRNSSFSDPVKKRKVDFYDDILSIKQTEKGRTTKNNITYTSDDDVLIVEDTYPVNHHVKENNKNVKEVMVNDSNNIKMHCTNVAAFANLKGESKYVEQKNHSEPCMRKHSYISTYDGCNDKPINELGDSENRNEIEILDSQTKVGSFENIKKHNDTNKNMKRTKDANSKISRKISEEAIDNIRKTVYGNSSLYLLKENLLCNKTNSGLNDESNSNNVKSTLVEMNRLDSELFTKYTNCPNCKNYLKQLTHQNYLHFSSTYESRKHNEQHLLALKTNEILQLRKQVASLQIRIENLSQENSFLYDKIDTFNENFIEMKKVFTKLLEENRSLKAQIPSNHLQLSEEQFFGESNEINEVSSM